MRLQEFAIAALVLAGMGTSAAARDLPVPAALAGTWVVVGNTVEGGPVQAYVPNDAGIIGARLTVDAKLARWTSRDPALARVTCGKPLMRPASLRRFTLACAGGGLFGPDSAQPGFTVTGPDRMSLRWFDGLVLRLRKQGPRPVAISG